MGTTATRSDTRRQIDQLPSLLEVFLRHLSDYRRCSPLTVDAYERECGRFIRYLRAQKHSLGAAEVSRGHIYGFLGSLNGLAPASVRRALYSISAFFGHLVDTEQIDRNPASGVEPPKLHRTAPRPPNADQCAALLDACETPTEQCVFGLLLMAGLRRAEVLGLDVNDVSVDFGQLRIDGKGGRERFVPISEALARILRRHLLYRDAHASALVVNCVGERMGPTTMYRLFRRVLRRAELDAAGITPHSLRHAFASHLVRAGVDVVTVSELLGHANIATTSIYLHSSERTKTEAVEKLQSAAPRTQTAEPQKPVPEGGLSSWGC